MTARFPILALALSGISLAGEVYTAPFGEGGTWNLYQRINQNVTWLDAKRIAEELKAPAGNPELSGHLVTLSSLAENQFMRQVAGGMPVWCGLTDNEGFGGQEAGSNPRKGWKWITGEPLTFSNWKPVEPDNWSTAG
ncbi:MAG: lectin-like protein, partial [Luteolibacter sp.]